MNKAFWEYKSIREGIAILRLRMITGDYQTRNLSEIKKLVWSAVRLTNGPLPTEYNEEEK